MAQGGAEGVIRVALDATSLLDVRTGVGQFTARIAEELAGRPDVDLRAFAVTWRGRGGGRLRAAVPAGAAVIDRPVPALIARMVWRRSALLPAEWLAGVCDVVHGPNFVVPPARWAAEVVTVHDLTTVHFPELCTDDTRTYPEMIRRAVARGAWVHAVSGFVADEVRDVFDVDPDRVVAIANGVPPLVADRPGSDAAAGRRLAGGPQYLLALGTVEPRKNLPLLVEAFDAVAATDPDLRLVIAGVDGWGADELASTWGRARARRRIRRIGWVTDAQRAALLRGAALFVYPSRYEGFGLPPLEAMAAGTPVVATDVGALPEVLGDGAYLVAGERDALAGAIGEILADPSLASRLVARGAQQVRRYDWTSTADGLVGLYRRAVADLTPASRRGSSGRS